MDVLRKEILPFVALTCLKTDRFKTACMSLNLLTGLTRETASQNALIPGVLRRGTVSHPDMDSLARALDELYGAKIEPAVRKLGEIQSIGFCAEFTDDAFLPPGSRVAERIAALMGELLISPNTRGGLFLPAYVDGERQKLIERIQGRMNEKRGYSLMRLREFMCPFEDYAVDVFGSVDQAEAIGYQKLTKHYKAILAASPIEIFYIGSLSFETVEGALKAALLNLPRGEADTELGTDIRMNSVEEGPRYFTEVLDVTQGKLAVGFRLGKCMENPDLAALRVFNAIYGGSVTSKLFMNVREKLSLCYFASSFLDLFKGLMLVSSGIEFEKYDQALSEILAQLDAVRTGDFTAEDLTYAKKYVSSSLASIEDSPAELESFYLAHTVMGEDCSPMDLSLLAESVTAGEVTEIARGIECDAVYFLKGITEEETHDDQ